MKKTFIRATLLGVVALSACAYQSPQPLEVGNKLYLPAGQTLVIPAGGILFSNGAMIGGAQ